MSKDLVIVESPAKARTVERFLRGKYRVKASLGHIRDLPKSQLGVDVENDFAPKYLIPKEKRSVVKELKEAAKDAPSIYLATDPDREGEAISWHLIHAANLNKVPVRRVVFHEITEEAIDEAFRHPRDIDMDLVNAQQARRVLDRLVGYKISPLLWRKVKSRLSAGRVQSVALRMVVEREREIEAFVPVEYWSIEAELSKKKVGRAKPKSFIAALVSARDTSGEEKKLDLSNKEETDKVVSDLEAAAYSVVDVRKKEVQRQPSAPFTTSTLQQEAARKLRFTAKRTMAVAQQLYEGLPIGKEGPVGLITYMRTDSTNVAVSAQEEARRYITQKFGGDFVPAKPRVFTRKAKGAQEAHEAIRPTSVRREPDQVRHYLTSEQFRLYELIWKRMVASQMAAAVLDTTSVDIDARNGAAAYLLRATGSVLRFPGFLVLYNEGQDEEEQEEGKRPLPELTAGEPLDLVELLPKQHFTQPPPRYTEATLVRALEENGIGRPSTYAPTLSTIQDRGYVEKVERRFRPTELGLIVSDLLAEHFTEIINVGFTARMEEDLDEIARGERQWVPVIREFYGPFEKQVEVAQERIPKIELADEPAGEDCDKCGKPMIIKMGRFGKFVACSGFPECRNTKPLLNKIGVSCPQCGGDLVEKRTAKRRRTFYGCSNYPNCTFTTWERPLGQSCPDCGGMLVSASNSLARCLICTYRGPVEKATDKAVGMKR